MLDSRAPPGSTGASAQNHYAEEEEKRLRATEQEVERLREETRIWRVANTAQWVAWGIVQAKLPELDAAIGSSSTENVICSDANAPKDDGAVRMGSDKLEPEFEAKAKEMATEEEEEDEFDYLGYAQERAMFFWGDVVGLGIVKKEELPSGLWEKCKVIEY